MKTVYFVGQWMWKAGVDCESFEIGGIFTTSEKAQSACRDDTYFVMEIELDKQAPHASTILPVIYPITHDHPHLPPSHD